jgi:hypothetical protein
MANQNSKKEKVESLAVVIEKANGMTQENAIVEASKRLGFIGSTDPIISSKKKKETKAILLPLVFVGCLTKRAAEVLQSGDEVDGIGDITGLACHFCGKAHGAPSNGRNVRKSLPQDWKVDAMQRNMLWRDASGELFWISKSCVAIQYSKTIEASFADDRSKRIARQLASEYAEIMANK